MSLYCIENDKLVVHIKSFGAEITSVKDKCTDQEYMWCGDEKYWKRQSPILFPVVGSLKNKQYKVNDHVYTMGQHGFARDMEFNMTIQSEDEIWFELRSDDATREMYPFDFILSVGYRLEGRVLHVMWNVKNTGQSQMAFSIGAHPAFVCPRNETEKQSDYYIQTNAEEKLILSGINMDNGLLVKSIKRELPLDADGTFQITEHMFDNDALVIEDEQVNMLKLLTPDKKPYITMKFDMPLCGIWSSATGNAPFICFEPWCGRCDAQDFDGNLFEREYSNNIDAGEEFKQAYSIQFD